MNASLALADSLHARSIAIPAISTGKFKFPWRFCAYIMFDAAAQFIAEEEAESLREINIVILNGSTAALFESVFDDLFEEESEMSL